MRKLPSLIVAILTFIFQKWAVLGYRAAVLEYYPLISDTPKSTIFWNLNDYRYFTAKAKKQHADIIVFPEYGLTTIVNNTIRYAIETDPYSDVITRLKAIASDYQIYMVVNLLERYQENHCCETPRFYNTNLVFDRKGETIAHYRKINLYNEDGLAPGSPNQNFTFSTDFGVTFGVFTSYDILYGHPSRKILANVTDVVYPTAWFSTLPFYTSLAFQHGYSISTGVNLLASSYNQPLRHLGGSGVYIQGGQNYKTNFTETPTTKLLVFDVPKSTKRENGCVRTSGASPSFSKLPNRDLWPKKDFYYSVYKFQNIGTHENTSEVCYGKFCCTFEISFGTRGNGTFKVMAFQGLAFFDQIRTHVSICCLLACENNSDDSCGGRVATSSTFHKIAVKKKLVKTDNIFYMPLTLNYDLQPLGNILYCNNKTENNSSVVYLSSTETEGNVAVFGIFGQGDSGVRNQSHYVIFLFISLLLLYI